MVRESLAEDDVNVHGQDDLILFVSWLITMPSCEYTARITTTLGYP